MFVYSLTPLTRDAKQDRRIVIKGFDMNRRHFIRFIVGQFLPYSCCSCSGS